MLVSSWGLALPGLAPAGHLLLCVDKEEGKKTTPLPTPLRGSQKSTAPGGKRGNSPSAQTVRASYPPGAALFWRRQKGNFNSLYMLAADLVEGGGGFGGDDVASWGTVSVCGELLK